MIWWKSFGSKKLECSGLETVNRNTKFFHSHVTDKRNKLQLKKIKDPNENLLDKEEDIMQEAITFYTDQLLRITFQQTLR
ncbi:hypothetical protein H5410_017080 [Solanum commersonii]|uniref:Uncharacterized protein n=1 Tax=Solanum commersonii TaxID=4109 RepID=A0A9J5ZYD4_SOLCO|nr:hypothetical protein H5410_017080 [Solanum commersonii]